MIRAALTVGVLLCVGMLACRSTGTRNHGSRVDPFPDPSTESSLSGQDLATENEHRIIPAVEADSADLSSPGNGLQLQPVFFAFDRHDITPAQIPVLEQNARVLLSGSSLVTIQGHCDERGTEEYNLALGDRRAQAVRDYLVSLGVEEERLKTISFGENQPFQPGHDEESWRQNRRAQFVEQPPLR